MEGETGWQQKRGDTRRSAVRPQPNPKHGWFLHAGTEDGRCERIMSISPSPIGAIASGGNGEMNNTKSLSGPVGRGRAPVWRVRVDRPRQRPTPSIGVLESAFIPLRIDWNLIRLIWSFHPCRSSAEGENHGAGGTGATGALVDGPRKARSTVSARSVDTFCASRHSHRMISGKIAPPCFWP